MSSTSHSLPPQLHQGAGGFSFPVLRPFYHLPPLDRNCPPPLRRVFILKPKPKPLSHEPSDEGVTPRTSSRPTTPHSGIHTSLRRPSVWWLHGCTCERGRDVVARCPAPASDAVFTGGALYAHLRRQGCVQMVHN